MTVNRYFQRGKGIGANSEQEVIEKTIIEWIQMAGSDFNYIVRDSVKVDKILNEDPLAQFTQNYTIEMYVLDGNAFGGQGQFLDKFGLNASDTIELIVSKRRFFEETNDDGPLEGNLIYWPLLKSLWQIDFIEDEVEPHYILSGLYTWKIKCSRYTFSHEDFDTGIKEVDDEMAHENIEIPFQKNDEINDEANDILDFDEPNPFGDVTEEDSNT